MPPQGATLPISRLIDLLRADGELQSTLRPEHWNQFNQIYAAYEVCTK